MNFQAIFDVVVAALLSLGGGALVVGAFAKFLAGIWARRILEEQKSAAVREQELLVRRRDVYSKLALSMRVFLARSTPSTEDERRAFLAAYDEAALWADETVINEVGGFLDLLVVHAGAANAVDAESLRKSYAKCIAVMRRDCGFPGSTYSHRLVTFQ